MVRVAVFASGTGTNFEALYQNSKKDHRVEIACLICDQPKAKVVQTAENLGIKTFAHSPKHFINKPAFEQAVCEYLEEKEVEFIILAGYMRIIGATLLDKFTNRIINIHPALLPSFPGKSGIEDALNYGVKVTGVTIHYVDAGIDSGKIIAQEAVRIAENETLETLAPKIHEVEHRLYYPSLIEALHEQNLLEIKEGNY